MKHALKSLYRYVRPYWLPALLTPALMALEAIMDLQQPALLGRVVDIGIANLDLPYVLRTGGLMVALGVIGAAGGASASFFSADACTGFAADLRYALMAKVQSLEFGNLDEHDTGELITRLTNDITLLSEALNMILRMAVRAPTMLAGGLVMAILTSPRLAVLMFALVPIVGVGIYLTMRKALPMYGRVQVLLDRVNTVMQESLAGVRVIKAFVRGDYERARFGVAAADLRDQTVSAARVVAALMPVLMGAVNIGIALSLWFGGRSVMIGSMSVGQVMAFINYLGIVLGSMMMVAMLLVRMSRAAASAARVVELLDAQPTINDTETVADANALTDAQASGARGQVVFDHVTFDYDGDGGTANGADAALDDVTFQASPGETIAILGATGSGKSTLVNLIPRFYDVTSGAVRVDGVDVRQVAKAALRANIGIALQEAVLFTGTVRDNIRYGRPDATDEEVVAAAKAAQAHAFITEMAEGYDTLIGARGVNLSGGQKQRVAIARALIMQPAILILDDSTSAVDVETEALIQDALGEIMRGRTSFVIAQRISTVLTADRILVLDEGRIAAQGNHEALMASSPIYREIYDSQLGGNGSGPQEGGLAHA